LRSADSDVLPPGDIRGIEHGDALVDLEASLREMKSICDIAISLVMRS